jgi:hypothetical protein
VLKAKDTLKQKKDAQITIYMEDPIPYMNTVTSGLETVAATTSSAASSACPSSDWTTQASQGARSKQRDMS